MQTQQRIEESKNLNSQEDQPTKEICVVGAGLIGLSVLASLIRDIKQSPQTQKFKITLVEKRLDFLQRSQKLIVNPNELVPGIEQGISWKEFCLELFDPLHMYTADRAKGILFKNGVALKKSTLNNREKLILKMLRKPSKERGDISFSIKSLQKALLEYIDDPANQSPNLEIEKQINHTVTSANLKKHHKNEKMSLSTIDKYDIQLMSEKNKERQPHVLYVNPTPDGLTYEVLGLDGMPKQGMILWNTLAKNFQPPQDLTRDKLLSLLPIILETTTRVGHTKHTPKKISFDALLLCEGEKREVTKYVVNNALKEIGEKPFTFKKFPHKKLYHCAIRLKFKSLDQINQLGNQKFSTYGELFKYKKNINKLHTLENLNKLGWLSKDLPNIGLNTNFNPDFPDKRPIFGLSSDIPESIYTMPEDTEEQKNEKNKKIIEWSLILASYYYEFPVEYFEFDSKGGDNVETLRISLFSPDREYIDRPFIEKEGSLIGTLGECAKSSYHPTGQSSQGEMFIAKKVSTLLVTGKQDLQDVKRSATLQKNIQAKAIYRNTLIGTDNPFQPSRSNESIKLSQMILVNNLKGVQELLMNGDDPDNCCSGSLTPLNLAIQKGYLDIARELLDNGANPNLIPSALITAVKNQNIEAINILFLYGYNPEIETDLSQLAIEAIKTNNLEIITKLIIGGVSPRYFLINLSNSSLITQKINEIAKLKEDYFNPSHSFEMLYIQTPPFYILAREQALSEFKKMYNNLNIFDFFKSPDINLALKNFSDKVEELNIKLACLKALDQINRIIHETGVNYIPLKDAINTAYTKLITQNNLEELFVEIEVKLYGHELIVPENANPNNLFPSVPSANPRKEILAVLDPITTKLSTMPSFKMSTF